MPTMKTDVLRDHVFRYPHLASMLGAHAGSYVIPGKEPAITERAAGANMSVDVGPFTYVLNGVLGSKATTTNVVVQASEANPRIDLLYLATNGTLTVLKGTARAIKPATESTWQRWEEPYPADFSSVDGLLLAEIMVPANAASIRNENIRNIAVPALPANFDSMCSVEVFLRGTEIIARKADGSILYSGDSATAAFDEAVDGCPDDGKIFIGPGTYELLANKQFYLSGSIEEPSNPFYYCIGILEGKNLHLEGSGMGVTVLKLADNQHDSEHHCAMILNRTTGPSADGHTGFSVRNMTIDGNKDNQATVYWDGAGLILTGSIRENEIYENLELVNSFGYGIYSGNNGSGPADRVIIKNIIAKNCHKSAICVDTVSNATISDCVITDASTGLEILGNTDYQTRTKDNVAVSNIVCKRAGITVWCMNDVTISNCQMDITGATSYGLQVHCSIGVNISGCRFKSNKTSQYVTYIEANTYMADGPCNILISDSEFDGYNALKVFGDAQVTVIGGSIHGYGSCIYVQEIDDPPCTAEVRLVGTTLLPDTTTTKIVNSASGSKVSLVRCHCPTIGAFSVWGLIDSILCTGSGLEGFNSRWREESKTTYSTTPANSSTITMSKDRTGVIHVGTPLKYIIGGVAYYGIVAGIASNSITVAGAPLSGTIQALYLGDSDMVGQIDYLIPGVFDASASNTLIQSLQKSRSIWRGRPAHLVRIQHIAATADSGTAPNVTASIAGNPVGTDNTNTGLAVRANLASTTVGINTSNYRVKYGDVIELRTTAGGVKDATYLTVLLTFVSEN